MRQVCLSDLHRAACAVQIIPDAARPAFCSELIWRAHVADKYVKRLRKLHPKWGDGSLRAAAVAQSEPSAHRQCSQDYFRALAVVLSVVGQTTGAKDGRSLR